MVGSTPVQGETIMTYVDGFVAAVPTANRQKFKDHAEEAAKRVRRARR